MKTEDNKSWLDKIFYPSPNERKSKKLMYEPNFIIKLFRTIAQLFITLFRLNTNNRLVVEIQQKIHPMIEVNISNDKSLKFAAGHGRLIWRAKTLFTEEPSLIEWIDQFGENEIFFDVGANVGIYSLYAAKMKQAKCYCFEAEINNVQLLYTNIFLNQLSESCTPIALACDSDNGVKPFYIREFSKGGAINSIGRKSFQLEDESKMYVQNTLCIKLDDLISLLNLPTPTMLKVDVDGNELQVIKGAIATLNSVKSVYIELFDELEEHNAVKEILFTQGFKIESRTKINATEKYAEMANYIFSK